MAPVVLAAAVVVLPLAVDVVAPPATKAPLFAELLAADAVVLLFDAVPLGSTLLLFTTRLLFPDFAAGAVAAAPEAGFALVEAAAPGKGAAVDDAAAVEALRPCGASLQTRETKPGGRQ
mmetsp:Transcript_60431/g.169391  ORF Transcript_60431/g.169391 Transcript_60431/m.169391 type:complete len:119 (+) Transcript_60431:2-358(+)